MGDRDEVGGLRAERDDQAGAGVGKGGVLAALKQELAEGGVALREHGCRVEGLVLRGVGVAAELIEGQCGRPGLAVIAGVDRRAGLDEHLDGGAGGAGEGGSSGVAASEQHQRGGGYHEPGKSSPHVRVRPVLGLRMRLLDAIANASVHLQSLRRVKFL